MKIFMKSISSKEIMKTADCVLETKDGIYSLFKNVLEV